MHRIKVSPNVCRYLRFNKCKLYYNSCLYLRKTIYYCKMTFNVLFLFQLRTFFTVRYVEASGCKNININKYFSTYWSTFRFKCVLQRLILSVLIWHSDFDLFGEAPLSKCTEINNCTCSEIVCESHLEFHISLNGADHRDVYF